MPVAEITRILFSSSTIIDNKKLAISRGFSGRELNNESYGHVLNKYMNTGRIADVENDVERKDSARIGHHIIE